MQSRRAATSDRLDPAAKEGVAMVARIFQQGFPEEVALQRLGAALVLQWSLLPEQLRQTLIQQALALSGPRDEDVHEKIKELLERGRSQPQ
jgi:hypothetical protein